MAHKKIILTADDYGACNFIDDAIIKAIKERKINSVAAFVTYPDSQIRVRRLTELQEEETAKGNHFGIGLHFSITAGWAVTRKFTTLSYPNGTDAIFRDAYDYPFRFVSKLEMQEELDAQIKLLASWLGSADRIDHVSNHHGVTYVDTDMFQCYAQVVQAFRIPMRSPLNWSVSGLKYKDFDPFIPSIPLARQGIKLRWIDKLVDVMPAHIHQRVQYARGLNIKFPYCVNDTFYGQPFYENLDFLLLQYADPIFTKNESDCAEMMFHLGNYENSPYNPVPSQQVQTDGIDQGYFNNRKLEFRTLRMFDVERALADLSIQKVTYREL
jgi:predicted glycoside hydrolase/deacetylase ChbG (UPF0249 family)